MLVRELRKQMDNHVIELAEELANDAQHQPKDPDGYVYRVDQKLLSSAVKSSFHSVKHHGPLAECPLVIPSNAAVLAKHHDLGPNLASPCEVSMASASLSICTASKHAVIRKASHSWGRINCTHWFKQTSSMA